MDAFRRSITVENGPKTSDLVQLIDSELELIEKQSSRPGWTVWALAGAIAGIAWMLARELENQDVVLTSAARWFIVAELTAVLLFHVYSWVTSNTVGEHRVSSDHRYMKLSDLFANTTPTFVFVAAVVCGINGVVEASCLESAQRATCELAPAGGAQTKP